jgi:LEA14-like dessication related protein
MAVQTLRYRLAAVKPSLFLTFPLEASRVQFRATLRVENPSGESFSLKDFQGGLELESGACAPVSVGQVALVEPVELLPEGAVDLRVDITVDYRGLRDHWEALMAACQEKGPGAWVLRGTLRTRVLGMKVNLPVKVRRSFGGPP